MSTSQAGGRSSFEAADVGGRGLPKVAKVDSRGRKVGERNAVGDEELIRAVEHNEGYFSAASAALQARWGRGLKTKEALKTDYDAAEDPELFKAKWAKALGAEICRHGRPSHPNISRREGGAADRVCGFRPLRQNTLPSSPRSASSRAPPGRTTPRAGALSRF